MAFATSLALEEAPPLDEVSPGAPRALVEIVARLLAKNPAERYASPSDVGEVLDRLIEGDDQARTERDPVGLVESGVPRTLPLAGQAPATTPERTLRVSATPGDGSNQERRSAPETSPHTMLSPAPQHDRPPRSTRAQEAPQRRAEAHASTDPPSPPAERGRSPMRGLAIVASLVLVAGIAAFAAQRANSTRAQRDAGVASTRGDSDAAPSADATNTTAIEPIELGAPVLRNDDRVALDRACREWSQLLSKGQRADGAFSGYAHADPSGWDTAQQLFALTEAHRACSGVGPAPLASAARALDKLRYEDGWIGPRRPSSPNYADHRAETPANAWAVLALSGVARATDDSTLDKAVARARSDLARARNPDGGFRYLSRSTGPSTFYSTMLAAWALLETEDRRTPNLSADTRGALAWLRREVAAGSETVRAPGAAEQVAWLLARGSRRGDDQGDSAVLRTASAEVVAHCNLDGLRCRRILADTGKIPLNEGAGKLVTLWHPWATVASFEIARDPALAVEPDTRRSLYRVARWGSAELGGALASLATAPEYKLAEYLIVVAMTLEPR